MINDVRDSLEQWGRWLSSGVSNCYVSPSLQLMRENVGGVVREARISDEDALKVDAAVCRLMKRKAHLGRAVFVYFKSPSMTYTKLGKSMGCNRSTAQKYLESGVEWLEGYFDEKKDAA